ncbi:MAG: phosphatase PAP2 family protein [Xanthomonadaceae bacterium]|nr:phosphatase PAP2 family protein [Xanthomonadaceae bacterium]
MLYHLALPVTSVLVLSWLLMGKGGDAWVADRIYALQGGHWALKRHFVTQQVIHHFGKYLSVLAGITIITLCVVAHRRRSWQSWRRPLLFLSLSVSLSTLLISTLKGMTNTYCPWELARYGGQFPFSGVFEAGMPGFPRGRCFPAGHASAGYAWVSLYFFALATRPRWRWWGLSFGVMAGLVFGIGQQLRGAHFLSHDLWTWLICWLTALGLFWVMFVRGTPLPAVDSPQPSPPSPADLAEPGHFGGQA